MTRKDHVNDKNSSFRLWIVEHKEYTNSVTNVNREKLYLCLKYLKQI